MRKESPNFTMEKCPMWCGMIKIYLKGMGEKYQNHIVTRHVSPTRTFGRIQLKDQQKHITIIEAIDITLSNAEYINVLDLETTDGVWEKLTRVYNRDSHVKNYKVENMNGKFYKMRMMENENIEKYSQRIKDVVTTIKVVGHHRLYISKVVESLNLFSQC